jgi:hypothetical protein
METHPGVGIDWHLANKLATLGQRPWDLVVAHGFSTLEAKAPGNPALLIRTAKQLVDYLTSKNPKVQIRLEATFPRADMTCLANGPWYGKTIEAMNADTRAGHA